jgi:hypothetical protein
MNTLRPGLLVSLNTSVRGNVNYNKEEIEADHVTEEGKRQAKWLTERVISDPEEHENAIKVRSKALSLVRSVCSRSAFGLLCPEIASESLQSAIAEARRLADEFNATATLTHVSVYVMIGRIAPDDVEAVKAINSEVRELMEAMEDGLKKLDPKTVRDAANRARNIGAMLTGDAAARVRNAIDVARSAARQIVKSAEEGEAEIDRQAIRRIEEARTAFLDFDDAGEIAAPQVEGRSLDLAPLRPVGKPTVTANAVEL